MVEQFREEQRKKLIHAEMAIVSATREKDKIGEDCAFSDGETVIPINKRFIFGMYVARRGLINDLKRDAEPEEGVVFGEKRSR